MSNEQRPPSDQRPFRLADLERARESDLGLEDEKTAPVSAPAHGQASTSASSATSSPSKPGRPAVVSRQPFEPLGVFPRVFDADFEVAPRAEPAPRAESVPYAPRGHRGNPSDALGASEESGVRQQPAAREAAASKTSLAAPRGPFGVPERTSAPPPPPVEPFMYLIPGPVGAARAKAAGATSRGMGPVESPRAERAHFGSDEPARVMPRVERVRPGVPVDLPPRTERTPRSGSTTVLQAYFEPPRHADASQTSEPRHDERARADAPPEQAALPRYRPHFYYIVASSVAAALAVLVLVSLRRDVRGADVPKNSATPPLEVRTNASLPAAALDSPSTGVEAATPPRPGVAGTAAGGPESAGSRVELADPAARPVPEPRLVRDSGLEQGEPASTSRAHRETPSSFRPSIPARDPSGAPARSQQEGGSRRPRTLDGVDIETPLIGD
jgi:hypothetical protein